MLVYVCLDDFVYQNYDDVKIGGMLVYILVYLEIVKLIDIMVVCKSDEFLNNNLNDVYVYGYYLLEVLCYVE